ncbi:hypothetical protein BU17DRAFT_104108 [Hysterangium stoloniferum]|nr:hypothetical protein BU17DRAFT_104108 [Hysterangium stoloniferum]
MEAVVFPLAAQHRIICVGDYVLKDDYPPGMLTEEELVEVSEAGDLYLWTHRFEYWNKDNGIFPPAAMVPWSPDCGITAEPDLEEMGITQAILSRICWSHDPSSSMAYQGDIHRGTWAGDRIDIMCENRHNAVLMAESKDPSKAPWKDVTEACVQMLLDIWSA